MDLISCLQFKRLMRRYFRTRSGHTENLLLKVMLLFLLRENLRRFKLIDSVRYTTGLNVSWNNM